MKNENTAIFRTLTRRNARRSFKDYGIYMATMTLVSALMFAFHSLMFSEDIVKLCEDGGVFIGAMIGMAAFFIVFIMAWLVGYIVRFMSDRRSREFGTYLLLGVPKKRLVRMFTRENLLLGSAAFVLGLIPGMFFQQVLTAVFMNTLHKAYRLSVQFSFWNLLLTLVIYTVVFWIALLKARRRIRKLTIRRLMTADKENERVRQKFTGVKMLLFPLSIGYILVFMVLLWTKKFNMVNTWFLCGGLLLAVYLLYTGLAAWVCHYADKGGRGVYRGTNLFLIRQFSSKIRTMRFTMGTLTVLFTIALLGSGCALMLVDYQTNMMTQENPFDILMWSPETGETPMLEEKEKTLEKYAKLENPYRYFVYTSGRTEMNTFFHENLPLFGTGLYEEMEPGGEDPAYYPFDTYMRLSDYNALRRVAGYEPVHMEEGTYLLQAKNRVKGTAEQAVRERLTLADGTVLTGGGVYTDGFCQSGLNGADYLIVVTNQDAEKLEPYYSVLEAQVSGAVKTGTEEALDAVEETYAKKTLVDTGLTYGSAFWADGTDAVFHYATTNFVKEEILGTMNFLITIMAYACIYVAVIFLCVALTVLAVQQLGDSDKYRFRYDTLRKLGLRPEKVRGIVRRQLLIYYAAPFAAAALISWGIMHYIGDAYIFYTGIRHSDAGYFLGSAGVFAFLFLIYFAATYVGFRRNIEQ